MDELYRYGSSLRSVETGWTFLFLEFVIFVKLCRVDQFFVVPFQFTFSKSVFIALQLIKLNTAFSFIALYDFMAISFFTL